MHNYSVSVRGEIGEHILWNGRAEDEDQAEGLANSAFIEEYGEGLDAPQIYSSHIISGGSNA